MHEPAPRHPHGAVAADYLFATTVTLAAFALTFVADRYLSIANLSLMFDLTVPEKVGLYIGAWGFSNGLSRLVGLLMAGVVADVATQILGNPLSGYLIVFSIEALMMFIAAIMLYRIDVNAFRRKVEEPAYVEKVALAAE